MNLSEAIKKIEELGGQHDPDGGVDGSFTVWDQLLACESVAASVPVKEKSFSEKSNGGINTKEENTNGKWLMQAVDTSLTTSLTTRKHQAFEDLQRCHFRTSPAKVAELLTAYFQDCPSAASGHWLYIATHWPPRPIVRTIKTIQKQLENGAKIVNPAALFTLRIKHRVRRKFPKSTMQRVNYKKNTVTVTANNTKPSTVQPSNMVAANNTARRGFETVSYHQLAPLEKYYYTIASRGGEEGYYARVKRRQQEGL